MGVNFGRLGFLASFTPEEFPRHLDSLLAKNLPIVRRAMIEASVVGGEVTSLAPAEVAAKRKFSATALNDAVITAGSPFHMIELELAADGDKASAISATASSSPHPADPPPTTSRPAGRSSAPTSRRSASRPSARTAFHFGRSSSPPHTVVVQAVKVNEGTTLFCDGQASTKLIAGDRVVIRKSPNDVLLVENPDSQKWRGLAEKLNWASSPKYNSPL